MPAVYDQFFQSWTMNILHHEKILAKLLNKVIDSDSIGVGKCSGCTSFAAEAFNSSQVILVQGPQHLHRDQSLDAVIPGLKYTGHPTSSNMFTDLVASSNQLTFKLFQRFTSTGTCNGYFSKSRFFRFTTRGGEGEEFGGQPQTLLRKNLKCQRPVYHERFMASRMR